MTYPVLIGRGTHWDGIPPGETEPLPIVIPEKLGRDEVYVPAGWTIVGGDRLAADSAPLRRVWVDAFVVSRRPVTNGEYVDWLNELSRLGRLSEAMSHRPKGDADEPYPLQGRGRFVLGESMGVQWRREDPVARITPASAAAFAAWVAHRTGQPWRLIDALEWEKAARGVDGRAFPMGDFLDPSWCNCAANGGAVFRVQATGAYPLDLSVYGVQGLAGNVRDICGSRYTQEGRLGTGDRLGPTEQSDETAAFEVRGGSLNSQPAYCRSASRFGLRLNELSGSAGFRLCRSMGRTPSLAAG